MRCPGSPLRQAWGRGGSHSQGGAVPCRAGAWLPTVPLYCPGGPVLRFDPGPPWRPRCTGRPPPPRAETGSAGALDLSLFLPHLLGFLCLMSFQDEGLHRGRLPSLTRKLLTCRGDGGWPQSSATSGCEFTSALRLFLVIHQRSAKPHLLRVSHAGERGDAVHAAGRGGRRKLVRGTSSGCSRMPLEGAESPFHVLHPLLSTCCVPGTVSTVGHT